MTCSWCLRCHLRAESARIDLSLERGCDYLAVTMRLQLQRLSQNFRKGVGGRGLATNSAQNTAKRAPGIVFFYS